MRKSNDPLISEQADEAQTNDTLAEVNQPGNEPLPESGTGREFVVLSSSDAGAVVDSGYGAHFYVTIGDHKVKAGDVVRVSWSEVDAGGHPLNGHVTSVK